MASALETMKSAEQILEKRICKLMIKKEEIYKEYEAISNELASLIEQSDKLFEGIKKLEHHD